MSTPLAEIVVSADKVSLSTDEALLPQDRIGDVLTVTVDALAGLLHANDNIPTDDTLSGVRASIVIAREDGSFVVDVATGDLADWENSRDCYRDLLVIVSSLRSRF